MRRMGITEAKIANGLSIGAFVLGTSLLASSALSGCALFGGKAACKAIDLVDQACPAIVEFVGTDGGTQRVSLSREDLIQVQAGRGRARDGGR